MKTAFIFPGQGSQSVGMGKAFFDSSSKARAVFEQANEALGFDLASLCFSGDEEELKLTANAQPAILTTSIACLAAFNETGKAITPDYVAGHSLGEYSALVAGGCLNLGDAVRVVRRRGEFMQEAVPKGIGAMAAIIGIDYATVKNVCEESAAKGVCSPANSNSPTQTVIAGHKEAVEYAANLAKERGARRAIMLAVSAPFHCDLMKPAADRLAEVLQKTHLADLSIPLVTNVDAKSILRGDEARDSLVRQVASPVLWSSTVNYLIDNGVKRFVEIGPGRVLSGLVKQISKDCHVYNMEDPDSLESVLEALGG
jgi:[acyl-carrier-protein] S-malonyltransferase